MGVDCNILRSIFRIVYFHVLICTPLYSLIISSSLSTGFFGFDPTSHTATIWDSGNPQFSATNVATIGEFVAKVLAKPEATANKSV